MHRSYLMRRPNDEDASYDYGEQDLVRAKPIDARFSRNLGPTYTGGKDFVRASEHSQKQFYGSQMVVGGESQQHNEEFGEGTSKEADDKSSRPMTHDERNKISASILKAELRGDIERVKKLKRKLEEGIVENGNGKDEQGEGRERRREVLLLSMDKRSGVVMPAKGPQKNRNEPSEKRRIGTVDEEFGKHMELSQMVAEEKTTTAEQQIAMFNRSAKVCSDSKTDEDWVVDDNMMSHPKKRRHEEKEIVRKKRNMVQGG
ncbi:hypothetical protein niasHS_006759 [Heterodera schachtii]|uniref:Uncharacterized protein n=1 Tax=Heterodera schachtii TaxID=97005 RepID=A0ABD2JIF3_HETSC